MFKKCLLHIGTEKTGTTSIQEWMKVNRAHLLSQGFYIPTTVGASEHIDLVNLIVNSQKKFSRRKNLGLNSLQSIDSYKKNLEQKFYSELDRFSSPDKTLIISSERFFSLLTHRHEISRLNSILLEYCSEIEIVCYIRPQHEFAKSIYSTLLRNGANRPNVLPDLGSPSREQRKYNYNQVLRFWEKGIPSAKLTVRRFTPFHLIQRNVVYDFSQIAGIDPHALALPEYKNVSLNRHAQNMLQVYNQKFPEIGGDFKSQLRRSLIKFLERFFSGEGHLHRRSDQQQFYEKFADSNRSLQLRYFPDSDELFDFPFGKHA